MPCSAWIREKQLPMPVYLGTSPLRILGFASWVWITSFTRSMGAVSVLDTAPETPPSIKVRGPRDEGELLLRHGCTSTQNCAERDCPAFRRRPDVGKMPS